MNIKKLFGTTITEREFNYYKEGKVSNLLKAGNIFTAFVQGSNKYKVTINLKEDTFKCNCPYEGSMCKHLAAVCHAINNKKDITTTNDIEEQLSKKTKEELVRIMREMLTQEPTLNKLLLSKEKQLHQKIEDIDTQDNEEQWTEFYDYIPDKIEEILEEIKKLPDKKEYLLLLLKKAHSLNEKYDHHGSTEDMMFLLMEEAEQEKTKMSKKDAKQLETQIKNILGGNYEQYSNED